MGPQRFPHSPTSGSATPNKRSIQSNTNQWCATSGPRTADYGAVKFITYSDGRATGVCIWGSPQQSDNSKQV